MKPIITILVMVCFLVGTQPSVFCQNPEEIYQKALVKEEGEGELAEAIKLYNQVAENTEAGNSLQAKALLHVGLCYEKLGKEEAMKAYQSLVNNFPGQKQEVAIARERLEKLIKVEKFVFNTPLKPTFKKIKIPTELSWSVKLSPDGKELALVSDKKIWKMPLSGNLGSDIPGTPEMVNTNGIEVEWSGLDWSRDGKWIAFNDYPKHNENGEYIENQSIFVVPSSGGEPKKLIENFRSARIVNYRISLSPDARKIAFSSIEDNKQHIFSTLIGTVSSKQLVEMEAREPSYSPDGKYIAFVKDKILGKGEGNLGLWVVPAEGGTPHLIANAGKASSPVWSPDGEMIAFLDYSKGKHINIVPFSKDKTSLATLVQIEVPEGIEEVRLLAGWTPDNKIGALLVSKMEFGLFSVPAKGGQAAIIMKDTRVSQPRWSHDSEQIYYVTPPLEGTRKSYRQFIASVKSSGGKGTPIKADIGGKSIKQFAFQSGNRISPDGKWIVTSTWTPADTNTLKVHWPTSKIWKVSVDGEDAVQITNTKGNFSDMSPCWSPDGKKVAFVRFKLAKGKDDIFGGSPKIYSINSSGGDPELLVSITGKYVNSVIWSPDGKTIAYLTKEIDEPHTKILNLFNVETKESQIVENIESANVNNEMAWSPDSKRIAVNDGEGKVIKIITLEDGSIEEISTGLVDVNIYHLDWSRDGERFVFGGWKGGKAEFWFVEDFLPLDKLTYKKNEESILIRKVMDGTGAGYPKAIPSPDGKYLAYIDWSLEPYDVVIREIVTGKEFRLQNQGHLNYENDNGAPYDVVWSSDSKKLAYSWENGEEKFCDLRVLDIDSKKSYVIKRVEFYNSWLTPYDWTPDGNKILVRFNQKEKNQIGLMSVNDASFSPLIDLDDRDLGKVRLSPDGRFVSFDRAQEIKGNENDLFVLSVATREHTRITEHPSHDYLMDWTPSGNGILFASTRKGTTDLYNIAFLDGSPDKKAQLIARSIGPVQALNCINDGTLFYSTPGGWWDIFSLNINKETGLASGIPEEIPLPNQGYNSHSSWSPDGEYLAYVSGKNQDQRPRELCIYSAKTGFSKKLNYPDDAIFPTWFPDSKSLLVNARDVVDIIAGNITDTISLKKREDDYIRNICITSDGKFMYFTRENRNLQLNSVNRRNIETGKTEELFRTDNDCLTITLSPDDSRLALQSRHLETTRILELYSVTSAERVKLHEYKTNEYRYIPLTWSPDNRYIYFSQGTDTGWELCRIEANGGKVKPLKVKMHGFGGLTMHPSGEQLAFYCFVGHQKPGEVWKMENILLK